MSPKVRSSTGIFPVNIGIFPVIYSYIFFICHSVSSIYLLSGNIPI